MAPRTATRELPVWALAAGAANGPFTLRQKHRFPPCDLAVTYLVLECPYFFSLNDLHNFATLTFNHGGLPNSEIVGNNGNKPPRAGTSHRAGAPAR